MALTSIKHAFFERTAPQTFTQRNIIGVTITENVNYQTDNMYRRERIFYEPSVGLQASFLCDFTAPCQIKTVNQPDMHWPSDHWSFLSFFNRNDFDEFKEAVNTFVRAGSTGNGPCTLMTNSSLYKERHIIGSFQQAGTAQVLRCGMNCSVSQNSGAGTNPTVTLNIYAGFALDTPSPTTRGMGAQINMNPLSAPLSEIPWEELYSRLSKFQVALTCGWATGSPNGWRKALNWTSLTTSIKGWISGRDDQATTPVDTTSLHFGPLTGGSIQPGNWTSGGTVDPTDPEETPSPKPPGEDDPVPPGPDDPIIPDPTDPIEVPDLPDIGGSGNGFFHVYNPSSVTLHLVADAFWSSNIIQQIVNYFTNPMETILGLGIVPVKPTIGGNREIHFGLVGSGISAPEVTSDYVIVNCGTRQLTPYYFSYLDYEPYTKMSMYIPYIGEFDLNPDEVTGRTIGVQIYVNVISGDLVGFVTADGTIVYIGAANCFRQLPVTSADMSQVIQSAISAITTIASAGAAGEAGAIANATKKSPATFSDRMNGAVGNIASVDAGVPLVKDIMSAKLHYHRCGQIGTGAGQLSYQRPYLTIIRPNLMLPDGAGDVGTNSDLKSFKGYPCNEIETISNLHGMTVIEDCRLSIPGATDEEIAEALEIMKGGFIA